MDDAPCPIDHIMFAKADKKTQQEWLKAYKADCQKIIARRKCLERGDLRGYLGG